MADVYGLRVWDASGKLRFTNEGRYFRLYSTLTHTVAAGGARTYSFVVALPGATNDGSWTIVAMGGFYGVAVYGVFSADQVTVTVRVYTSISARTMQLWIMRG